MRLTRIAVTFALLTLAALPVAVVAQTDTQEPAGTANAECLFGAEAEAFVALHGGPPTLNRVAPQVIVCYLVGFDPVSLWDIQEEYGVPCEGAAVYKISSTGLQDIWQAGEAACVDGILTIIPGGTGHYPIYLFRTAAQAGSAPELITPISVGTA